MEIYTKYSIRDGCTDTFREQAHAIAAAARKAGTALRCDWFIHAQRRAAVHMLAHRDEAALGAYRGATQSLYDAIAASADGASMEILDSVSDAFRASITRHGVRQADFAYGLKPRSAALDFSAAGPGTAGHIEIYTRFFIQPGKLDRFKTDARALLDVVVQKDPGTLRYDWFFNDSDHYCLALDSYADAQAMFAHMRNCHAAHAKLMEMSTITTEFLGALSDEAMQAVAKYDPFILPFACGLKPLSAGAFG
jgi:quinol monooxygenase YgiN